MTCLLGLRGSCDALIKSCGRRLRGNEEGRKVWQSYAGASVQFLGRFRISRPRSLSSWWLSAEGQDKLTNVDDARFATGGEQIALYVGLYSIPQARRSQILEDARAVTP